MSNLVIFLCALFATSLAVEKRRDDKWPPPEIVEAFKPIGQVCRSKTGVTEGVF